MSLCSTLIYFIFKIRHIIKNRRYKFEVSCHHMQYLAINILNVAFDRWKWALYVSDSMIHQHCFFNNSKDSWDITFWIYTIGIIYDNWKQFVLASREKSYSYWRKNPAWPRVGKHLNVCADLEGEHLNPLPRPNISWFFWTNSLFVPNK